MLAGADLYLHHKHGVNIWGYRGPALGRKQPGERRVAVLGGSTTWGYGLRAGQDFPAQLQQMLTKNGDPVKIINLGFNNEGAYSFTNTLADYEYLDFDEVVLYSGYNDLSKTKINKLNFRHRSPIFTATGYLPLLPALTLEKLSGWKRSLMHENDGIVFTPRVDEQRLADIREKLKALGAAPGEQDQATSATCLPQNQFYCERIVLATTAALEKGKSVLIVGEPYINEAHIFQQNDLHRMLTVRFAQEPRVRYLDLGSTVDLRDANLCWDGMHLTAEGNRRIAAALSEPVRAMLPP